MTFALLVFIALAALAARVDHQAAREVQPTHPYDELLMRQAALARYATQRGNPALRGERNRPHQTNERETAS